MPATLVPSFSESVTGAAHASPGGESVRLLAENERLQMENKRLRAENEQLRGIFDDAVDQFNSLKKKVEKLSGELEEERKDRKELEGQNLLLKKGLSSERAKANKFGDMLFGLKSEKLKLSDIKIVDDDTLAVDESAENAEDDRGRKDKSSEDESSKKKKKKTGGQP